MAPIDFRPVLDAALQKALALGQGMAAKYRAKLSSYVATSAALASDLAAGNITGSQAQTAAEQLYNATRSEIISAGYEAETAALDVAQSVLAAVLKLLTAAVVP